MSEKKLTLKQELFVEAYLGAAKGNGGKAARMAGYKGNDDTLRSIAVKNLRTPSIASRVSSRVTEAAMTADEVLMELTKVAKADWREFVTIRYDKEGATIDAKLQLRDKLRALELMGKYHGLFKEAEKNPKDAARQTLVDLRARYPELSEEMARQIVSETFCIQESELVS